MPATRLFGEPSRLIQMVDIANVEIIFKNVTIKVDFFEKRSIYYIDG